MPALPEVFRVRQHFPAPRLEDPPAEVRRQLEGLGLERQIRTGDTVAITVGSRGIANIELMIRAVVDHFRRLGAEPFLVPAMGSHGGGTSEGQQALIESYGVTEVSAGCRILSSMETEVLFNSSRGTEIHFDKNAAGARHVLVVGRVKPHTIFAGRYQSGLAKMLLIGLGKDVGARQIHEEVKTRGLELGFDELVDDVADRVIEKGNVIAGLAIVENARDETALVEAVPRGRMLEREQGLLAQASAWMGRLPFDAADVLVVDAIGKNISGSGMDTNVIGRKKSDYGPSPGESPTIETIVVRGLTPGTHGNAMGIGLATYCHERVPRNWNQQATEYNAQTSCHAIMAQVPPTFASDRELLEAAIAEGGERPANEVKLMRIPNTLHLAEVECSAAFWDEAQTREDLEVLEEPRPWEFDEAGDLM